MAVWRDVSNTLLSEFGDLADAAEITRITVRLALAALLGGLLGFEREYHRKAAGMRTHMLVALGAALFVLVPEQAGASNVDLTRVIQGVVVGIGFLGAGTILKADDEQRVKGLTTAAGIWLTAAIGVTVGLGREASAVLSTVLALLVFSVVPKLSRSEHE